MLPKTETIDFKWLAQRMEEREPKLWELFHPRRYSTPAGYRNPRDLACVFTGTGIGVSERRGSECGAVTMVVAGELAKFRMPLWCAGRDFLDAAWMTKPPGDTLISDLKLPMPAMTLALPIEFSERRFGIQIPFVSFSTVKAGNQLGLVHFESDMLLVVFSAFLPNNRGSIEYYSSLPLRENLDKLNHLPEFRFTTDDYVKLGQEENQKVVSQVLEADTAVKAMVGGETGEREMLARMVHLVTKVLVLLTARPDFLELGDPGVDRPGKVKKGRTVDALWAPKWIGRDYRLPCRQEGTHSSPVMHWRRAHAHWVRHGEGRTLKRLAWYEMTLVNSKTDENQEQENKSTGGS